MGIKIFLYAIAFMVSTFAVTGINFDSFIKRNHVWEARFIVAILVIASSYILANFAYDIVMIVSN